MQIFNKNEEYLQKMVAAMHRSIEETGSDSIAFVKEEKSDKPINRSSLNSLIDK